MSKIAKQRNPWKRSYSFLITPRVCNMGLIKVRLVLGQVLNFNYFAYTDEGFISEAYSVHLDRYDLAINRRIDTVGRDCDGRLETYLDCCCPLQERYAFVPYAYPGEKRCRDRYPLWQTLHSSQRDEFAEAAGY